MVHDIHQPLSMNKRASGLPRSPSMPNVKSSSGLNAAGDTVQAVPPGAVAALAKPPRGGMGFLFKEGGGLKYGNAAKAAAGTGLAGFLGWSMFDPKAGEKAGKVAGNVGNTVGAVFGGTIGGLVSGLLQPQYIVGSSVSCFSSCMLILVFFLMQ